MIAGCQDGRPGADVYPWFVEKTVVVIFSALPLMSSNMVADRTIFVYSHAGPMLPPERSVTAKKHRLSTFAAGAEDNADQQQRAQQSESVAAPIKKLSFS